MKNNLAAIRRWASQLHHSPGKMPDKVLALCDEVEQLRHDNAAYLRLIERLEGEVIEQTKGAI